MTVLWSDEKIAEHLGYLTQRTLIKRMRDEYEKELATRNETIGRLQGENSQLLAQAVTAASLQVRLDAALARIAELEAAKDEFWMQLIADEEHIQEDKTVLIENQGQWVGIKRGDVVLGVWLNELGCAVMRKVRPAA